MHTRVSGFVLSCCLCSIASAQVFDVSPTATTGRISEGDGQALYGGFGLNAAADGAAYNNYRKFGQRDTSIPLQEAANDPGNPSSKTWTGLYHDGSTGIIDPGMYIGTSARTTSDPDQLLYLKPLIDEEGSGNGDSNFRQDWDLRFGFFEDPNAFIESREPNSEAWDLWSGEWATDGVSAQLNAGTNDLLDETDWYTRMGAGFRLNAADNLLDNEGGREAHAMERTYAGSGEPLFEAMNENAFAGAGYDDGLEVSWGMELNDPGNADPGLAREVKLSVKVGNIVHTGVFDPGDANNPVEPNPGDPVEYSDGFFDWQASTPIFFMAPSGGTANGTGTVGIFIPGDFNADGTVTDDDGAILQAHLGEVDTTYSRGDIDQDGDTDGDDLAAWQNLSGGNPILQPGDADQDLDFDQLDLVKVQVAAKYLTGLAATWGEGDWNGGPGGSQGSPPTGNGLFDQLDIIAALNAGKYLTGPYAAIQGGGSQGDGQTSVVYDPSSGELSVDASASSELTSINIDSAASIFNGDAAANLGGSFDNDADDNIFKATFGGSFGSISFGNVAQAGLSEDFLANDLTVVGSLAGGGDLGAVDLVYVPEPSAFVLAALGLMLCLATRRKK